MGRPIYKGSTDQSTVIRILDSTTFLPENAVEYDTAGIALWYRREQSAKVTITPAALAALDSAHTNGGIELIGDGWYRLDLPDGAGAVGSGKDSVHVGGTLTGMIVIGNEHALVDYDPYDTVRLGLTALPNAAADAAGGLPISDVGGLDLDTKLANANEITAARMGALTDWINGGRLDLLLDAIPTTTAPTVAEIQTEMEENGASLLDTIRDDLDNATDGLGALKALIDGLNDISTTDLATALTNIHLDHLLAADYDPASKPGTATALLNELVENDGGVSRFTANTLEEAPSAGTNPNVLVSTTIAVVTDQTHFTLTAGSNDDDAYKDQAIVIYDASDSDFPTIRKCSAYTGATKTITLDNAPDFTIVNGDGVKAFVTAPGTTAPTVGEIQAEIEENGASLLDTIRDDLDNATDGLGALKTLIEAVPTVGEIKTELEADGTKLDHIWEMTEDDGGVRRLTTNALEQAPSGGLSAQETRDALKLAPTVGAPAAGSVDDHLDDIVEDSNELQGNQGNWATAVGFSTHDAAAVKTAMEAEGASDLDTIADAIANGSYGLSALQVLIAALQSDLDNGTDGLGALKVLIDAVPTTKTGYSLASTGMDSVICNVATVGATPTLLLNKTQGIWNKLFAKKTVTASAETAYESDNSTVMKAWTLADDETTVSRTP